MTQPFYHRVDGILFMSTTGFGEKEFLDALGNALRSIKLGVDLDTLEIEPGGYSEPEPGDPQDL